MKHLFDHFWSWRYTANRSQFAAVFFVFLGLTFLFAFWPFDNKVWYSSYAQNIVIIMAMYIFFVGIRRRINDLQLGITSGDFLITLFFEPGWADATSKNQLSDEKKVKN